jgi:SAM-dependent methyltransferase
LLHIFPLRRILVVGVYHGRDICFLMKAAENTGRQDLQIVGVDKFSDDFCRDWPEEKRALGWEAAGYGRPPTLQDAHDNISRHQTCPVELVPSDDLQFLAQCREQFDFIYLDTAHDYETVAKQIELCRPLLSPGGLLGGDDLMDESTEGWGVRAAVKEKFTDYMDMNGWIWLTHGSQYRSATSAQVA